MSGIATTVYPAPPADDGVVTCGTTIFSVTAVNTTTPTAALVFLVQEQTMAANTACTITTSATTATTPRIEEASTNDQYQNEFSVDLDRNADPSPTIGGILDQSTTDGRVLSSGMVVHHPLLTQLSKISVSFRYAKALAANNEVAITLPGWLLYDSNYNEATGGTRAVAAAPTTTLSSCGAGSFTAEVKGSGENSAQIIFVVASAGATYTTAGCSVETQRQTAAVASAPQAANSDSRTLQINTDGNDPPAFPITTSTATIQSASLGQTVMFLTPPFVSKAMKVTLSFTFNFAIETCDVVTMILPEFKFTTYAPIVEMDKSCASAFFKAKLINSGTSSAAVLLKSHGSLDANSACIIAIPAGIVAPDSQNVNLATRTMSFEDHDYIGGSVPAEKIEKSPDIHPAPPPVSVPTSQPKPLPTPTPVPTPTPQNETNPSLNPTPTPITPLASSTVSFEHIVNFGYTPSEYGGSTKKYCQLGYGDNLGLTGCQGTAALVTCNSAEIKSSIVGRRSIAVLFVTNVNAANAAAVQEQAKALTPASLTAAINAAAAGQSGVIEPTITDVTLRSSTESSTSYMVIIVCAAAGGIVLLFVIIAAVRYCMIKNRMKHLEEAEWKKTDSTKRWCGAKEPEPACACEHQFSTYTEKQNLHGRSCI